MHIAWSFLGSPKNYKFQRLLSWDRLASAWRAEKTGALPVAATILCVSGEVGVRVAEGCNPFTLEP